MKGSLETSYVRSGDAHIAYVVNLFLQRRKVSRSIREAGAPNIQDDEWALRRARPNSATAHGATSSTVTTPSSAEIGARPWTRRVTASWGPSTGLLAQSGPRAPSPSVFRTSRSISGAGCTRGGGARRRLCARDRGTHRCTDGRTRRFRRSARDLHSERPGRGLGIEFEDRGGARTLKDVPGKWHIFRVTSA
jgi:hypothetical protein